MRPVLRLPYAQYFRLSLLVRYLVRWSSNLTGAFGTPIISSSHRALAVINPEGCTHVSRSSPL